MSESSSPSSPALRIGVAVSIAVHLAALIAGLGYAGFLLAPAGPEQSIAVDLVSPQEVADLVKPPEPEPAKPPDKDFSMAEPKSEAQPPAAAAAPPPPQQQQQPPPESKPQSAASKPAVAKPQEPPSTQQPQTQAVIKQPEPDISLRYPMNPSQFGLSPGDFDAKAASPAQIDGSTVAAFRKQLKTCSTLPADISPDDKVVIVIRAQFLPDGRLSTTPILIEASASSKGPYLMQAAIAALQACQPYASLPADKYQEWKLLDLRFTPQDFRRG